MRVSWPAGHYRAGRYLPAQLVVDSGGGTLRLSMPGAIATEMPVPPGRHEVIIPVLAWSHRLEQGTWALGAQQGRFDPPPAALDADQRLVGLALHDPGIAAALFPASRVTTVALGPLWPPPGTALAWQTLDAVVLDAPSALRLGQQALRDLLAGGTVVCVRGGDPSLFGGRWPGRQIGPCVVYGQQPAIPGPRGVIEPVAYEPTFTWKPAIPRAVRRQAVILGVLVAIVMLLAWLLTSRGSRTLAMGVAVGTVVGTMLLLAWWRSRQPVTFQAGGVVQVVHRDGLVRTDRWYYQAAAMDTEAAFGWQGPTWPVFYSEPMLRQAEMTMQCAGGGAPLGFRYRLATGARLAFVARDVGSEPWPGERRASPLRLLAPLYAGEGTMAVRPGADEGAWFEPW